MGDQSLNYCAQLIWTALLLTANVAVNAAPLMSLQEPKLRTSSAQSEGASSLALSISRVSLETVLSPSPTTFLQTSDHGTFDLIELQLSSDFLKSSYLNKWRAGVGFAFASQFVGQLVTESGFSINALTYRYFRLQPHLSRNLYSNSSLQIYSGLASSFGLISQTSDRSNFSSVAQHSLAHLFLETYVALNEKFNVYTRVQSNTSFNPDSRFVTQPFQLFIGFASTWSTF